MDKCINTKHPEFIELAKQANMNPLVLKSKIGVWQERNNSDEFPTLEELGIVQETPNLGSDNNIKEGVSELFESNPELANKVYEALGFKTQKSDVNSEAIEKLKEKIKALRNEDGTIPDAKINDFRNLKKQIQFLERDTLSNINRALQDFIDENKLSESDARYFKKLATIRDNFQELVEDFNEAKGTNYTTTELMSFFNKEFNLQESIKNESEINKEKNQQYEKNLLENNAFEANKDYTANELDEFVQKHGSEQVKFIWNLIKAVAQKLGVTTRFMLDGTHKIPADAAGHYFGGKIENKASLFSNPKSAARIIVHELVHGVTTYILKAVEQNNTKVLSKLTNRQLKAVEKLNALFNELKKDKEFDDTYGTKNTHELLAELTNESFTDKLKAKNIFEKILEAIFEIFNIPFNAYNESIKILEDLISNPIIENRYEGAQEESFSLYSQLTNQITPQQKQKAQQLYSQYLDTIFPDSKVKDIVYHGTNKIARENILKEGFKEPIDEELEDMQDSLIWFSKNKYYYYKKEDKNRVSIPSLVNIKYPNINSHENFLAYGDASGIKAYNLSGDGLITQEEDAGDFMMERAAEAYFSEYGKYPDNYKPNTSSNLVFTAVPTAKQIHILGSKQDIEGFKSWVDSNQSNVQYQKQIDLQAEQDSVLEEFANSLSERFNISFALISEEEAKSISPEYANEPAFFDPKTKKAYLVKGKANKTSAIHEIFTHPFLLQIEKTNPTLYKNLLKEAKNNKSVVDYVDNLYGTNQNNDHEYIARAIDLAVQGELDQQKDKTLLERIQDFFNQLYDYLKKLFNIPEVFSSAISPNITLQQLAQFAMYSKGKMNLNPAQENIEYSLKATNVIVKNLDRIKQWEKNKSISEDVLWNKIQGLGVPKEQLELIKNSEGNTVEEKLLNFANEYSYTIEINTAIKEDKSRSSSYIDDFTLNGDVYSTQEVGDADFGGFDLPTKNGEVISEEEYKEAKNEYFKLNQIKTSYYSNLTVPGGTNYTENAIQTPNIINISRAHIDDFAKGIANMLGWFRSDEQVGEKEEIWEDLDDWVGKRREFKELILHGSKTRRILEIQSDLFQKGRDKEDLINTSKKIVGDIVDDFSIHNFELNEDKYTSEEFEDGYNFYYKNGKEIGRSLFVNKRQEYIKTLPETKNSTQNQFLQLLNKDSNWVTFFIKSIIQDSAKKGYEKVLFPKGETAAKIEGHETIAEEIIRIDAELDKYNDISKLNIRPYTKTSAISIDIYDESFEGVEVAYIGNEFFYKKDDFTNLTLDEAKVEFNRVKNNLKQKKAELKSQGIEKFKPIEAFYEIKVGNILEKQFGKDNVKTVTDEYGNTWNEVTIDENRDNQNIVFQKTSQSDSSTQYQLPQAFAEGNKIKKGVQELFESNPELASIGNQQQYSEYLDTITNEAIVYKGFKNKAGYIHNTPNHSFFTNSFNIADKWYNDNTGIKTFAIPKVSVESYKATTNKGVSTLRKQEEEYINNSKAGLIKLETNDIGGLQTQYVVNKKYQPLELGSKEDLEGFKEFIKGSNNSSQQSQQSLAPKTLEELGRVSLQEAYGTHTDESLISTAFSEEYLVDLELFSSYFNDTFPFQDYIKANPIEVQLSKKRELSDNGRSYNAYYSLDKKRVFVGRGATEKDLFSAILEYYLLENEDIDVQDILFDMVDKINSRDNNFKVSSTEDIIHNLFINEKMKDFLKTQESTMEEYKNLFDEFVSIVAEKGNLKKQEVLDILERYSRIEVAEAKSIDEISKDYPDVFSMQVLNNIEEC